MWPQLRLGQRAGVGGLSPAPRGAGRMRLPLPPREAVRILQDPPQGGWQRLLGSAETSTPSPPFVQSDPLQAALAFRTPSRATWKGPAGPELYRPGCHLGHLAPEGAVREDIW